MRENINKKNKRDRPFDAELKKTKDKRDFSVAYLGQDVPFTDFLLLSVRTNRH
jgi:hypothetical protein